MRFSFAIVALAATVVTAQLSSIVAKIPSCALTCLATSAAAAGCGVSDYACQCGAKRVPITTSATPCVLQGCTTEQALGTLGTVNELCEFIASNSPASSSSAAAPAPTTTGTKAVTAAPGTTTAAQATASFGSFVSSIISPTKVTSAPLQVTSAPAPIQVPTGSASRMRVGAGVIGGALLAAIAL